MLLVFITGCLALVVGILLLLGPQCLEKLESVLRTIITLMEHKVILYRVFVGIIFALWGLYFIYLYFSGLKMLS